MSPKKRRPDLSRRENQVMDILVRLQKATASEIQEELPDPPSNSAVRSILRILLQKNLIRSTKTGRELTYSLGISKKSALSQAVEHLVSTYFGGSSSRAAASLVELSSKKMTPEELDELIRQIEAVKRKETP